MFSWLCDELLHTIIEADEHQTWASTFFASKEMGARMQGMCATCDLCKHRLRSVLEHLCKNDLAHHLRPILDDDRVRKSGIVSEPDSLLYYCEGAECTRILVALAPDDLFQEMDGESPLIRACRKGLSACAEVMLTTLPDRQVLLTDSRGFIPLAIACLYGHHVCVELLLRHKHDEQVLAVNSAGTTALMRASAKGHHACVKLLLRHKHDEQVLAANSHGLTPLLAACVRGTTACMKLLLRHRPKEQVLAIDSRWTESHWNPACAKLLLRHRPHEQVAAEQRER